jgi:hypothetical protein
MMAEHNLNWMQLWYRILPFRAAVYACATDPTMPSVNLH